LPETKSLYYTNDKDYDFSGKILEVMLNVVDHSKPNIVVLDQSSFYPTSGGQEHDTGKMWIDEVEYEVIDVMKVGPCVLHVLSPPLPAAATYDSYKGKTVRGLVNEERRSQLRNHHTATHIVYASCRKVLGPHVWQHGAKKTVNQAHLDITHFQSLSHEDMLAIENEANRIVHRCKEITKGFMAKDEAEKQYGFHLYQGGVVPGNELRVVNISDTDTEACCGTHASNTAEVGLIKLIKSARISDGIVRLYYVAGEHALGLLNNESHILESLTSSWGIHLDDVLPTANRFFDGYKKYSSLVQKQNLQILDLQMKVLLAGQDTKLACFHTSELNATMFIGNMPGFAQKLKDQKKGAVFVGSSFVYGLLGDPSLVPALSELDGALQKIELDSAEEDRKRAEKKAGPGHKEEQKSKEAADTASSSAPIKPAAVAPATSSKPKQLVRTKDTVVINTKDKKGKKVTEKVTGVVEFVVFTYEGHQQKVVDWFQKQGFTVSDE
jgi:alanyl-tRNA synthetase